MTIALEEFAEFFASRAQVAAKATAYRPQDRLFNARRRDEIRSSSPGPPRGTEIRGRRWKEALVILATLVTLPNTPGIVTLELRGVLKGAVTSRWRNSRNSSGLERKSRQRLPLNVLETGSFRLAVAMNSALPPPVLGQGRKHAVAD